MADADTSPSPTSGKFATFGWGSGKGELGHKRPKEANPEGPMSLAADGKGGVDILDQVNHRIVHVGPDGTVEGSTDIDLDGAQDVAVAKDGTVAVLDRLGDRQVRLYGPHGKDRGTLTLEGKGIDEGGAVTGLFTDGDDVYAEREHGPLVKLGDTSGNAGDRSEIPGRPSRDGKLYLSAGITDAAAGRVWVSAITRATGDALFTRELLLGVHVANLLALDSDRQGVIYFASEIAPGDQNPMVLLYCLAESDGHPLGNVQFAANTMPEETFKEIVVLDGGGVLHAEMTDNGVVYQRYDCR